MEGTRVELERRLTFEVTIGGRVGKFGLEAGERAIPGLPFGGDAARDSLSGALPVPLVFSSRDFKACFFIIRVALNQACSSSDKRHAMSKAISRECPSQLLGLLVFEAQYVEWASA